MSRASLPTSPLMWNLGIKCPHCHYLIEIQWADNDWQGDEFQVARDCLQMHIAEECEKA